MGVTISALLALTACSEPAERSDAVATISPTRNPTPPEETRPTNSSGPVTTLPASGDLVPGSYALTELGQGDEGFPRRLIVKLPAGWATSDGIVHKRIDQRGAMTLSARRVDYVFDDPCHWQASTQSELDIANHRVHQDLHQAATGSVVPKAPRGGLANQESRSPSQLLSVDVGEFSALKIELSVPLELDTQSCDLTAFRPWASPATDTSIQHVPGQTDVVYMVDLDRAALVIDASYTPQTTASDLAEFEGILASMTVDLADD
jgi:hypothetical protein